MSTILVIQNACFSSSILTHRINKCRSQDLLQLRRPAGWNITGVEVYHALVKVFTVTCTREKKFQPHIINITAVFGIIHFNIIFFYHNSYYRCFDLSVVRRFPDILDSFYYFLDERKQRIVTAYKR